MSHDDIRHSLEVLDSVLAEFDDCLESWDTTSTETHERLQWRINRRRATHGPFNFRNRQTARIFNIDSVKSIPRIHGWWKKNLRSGKEQLALTVHGERRLRRIVLNQRSQTLAQPPS
ncbi:HTH_Tnp_Tc3_2 domain-containing protein [Trichonephila clavipes]|nr:HTH_Tnp_Tc3_2 domain-containing protein [Trichonephila clavipes]